MDAAVIIVCAALVLIGVLVVVRDGQSVALERAWPSLLVRRFAAGVVGGVLAAGAGGRLVVGVLALSSPDAHGMVTEAEARIGEVTAGGTVGFIVFVGLPAGVLCAVLFEFAGPALPRGRLGGVVLGLVLLVLAGPLIDPLRWARAGTPFVIQRRTNGAWTTIASGVTTGEATTYSVFSQRIRMHRTSRYRTFAPSIDGNHASGVGRTIRVSARLGAHG